MSHLNNNKKNILLIGGCGFIGHNLALHLNEHGHNVSVIDSFSVNNLGEVISKPDTTFNKSLYLKFLWERQDLLRKAGISISSIDARNYIDMNKTIDSVQPDCIIHLAAVAHANKSNKDPYRTFDHSMRTLENALDCARGNVSHFVYFSSSMIYGNFQTDVVTEKTECNPIGIYGALKFGAEKLLKAYNQVFDLKYTIIRPSALYGERCISQRVIQKFLESALTNSPLEIKGNSAHKLDFTYIKDLCDGVEKTILCPAALNETFNITYGQGRSIQELVNIIKTYFPNIKVKYNEEEKLTPERGTLSIEKAKTVLNYNPKYNLESGISNYLDFYTNFSKV